MNVIAAFVGDDHRDLHQNRLRAELDFAFIVGADKGHWRGTTANGPPVQAGSWSPCSWLGLKCDHLRRRESVHKAWWKGAT